MAHPRLPVALHDKDPQPFVTPEPVGDLTLPKVSNFFQTIAKGNTQLFRNIIYAHFFLNSSFQKELSIKAHNSKRKMFKTHRAYS
jgi:hypothetical protein